MTPVREALGFVSAGQRWLTELCAVLRQNRVPVREARVCDGELRFVFSRRRHAPLELRVTPKCQGHAGVIATERFMIGYAGALDLDAGAENMLNRFRDVLGQHETLIPERLWGVATLGVEDRDPLEALRRGYPFITIECSDPDQGGAVEVLLRTVSRCNQDCPYCSGSVDLFPSFEAVSSCLRAVAEHAPGATVSITGGEPTIKASFADEVDLALDLDGISHVRIQTNAVNFAQRVDPARWRCEGRLSFFCSLHAVEAARYDRCTGSEGQFAAAEAGLARLVTSGHPVVINTVVTSANLDHLERVAEYLAQCFCGPHRPVWHLSVLICPDQRPRASEYLVEYRALIPALEAAQRRARALGVLVDPLLSSTHASPPPCVVAPAQRQERKILADHRLDTGYDDFSRRWVKTGCCRECDYDASCLGVPTAYARRFGFGELRPVLAAGKTRG